MVPSLEEELVHTHGRVGLIAENCLDRIGQSQATNHDLLIDGLLVILDIRLGKSLFLSNVCGLMSDYLSYLSRHCS